MVSCPGWHQTDSAVGLIPSSFLACPHQTSSQKTEDWLKGFSVAWESSSRDWTQFAGSQFARLICGGGIAVGRT